MISLGYYKKHLGPTQACSFLYISLSEYQTRDILIRRLVAVCHTSYTVILGTCEIL